MMCMCLMLSDPKCRPQRGHLSPRYSEQKNRFAKGQNLLVSQITAQGTKVKACEFYKTKIDTLSFATPKYRTLVPAIGFIYILQWATHNESVFLHTLKYIKIRPSHTGLQH